MVKLYHGQVPRLAQEIISALVQGGELDITPAKVPEAEKDIAAVMDEYIRAEQRVVNRAKDLLAERRESREVLGRLIREEATAHGHQRGEEGIRWVQHQIIEVLMASPNVEELYGDDAALLKKIRDAFDRVLVSEETLDAEVRARLKNVEEGTPSWDIQYQKTMREIRVKHGLSSKKP